MNTKLMVFRALVSSMLLVVSVSASAVVLPWYWTGTAQDWANAVHVCDGTLGIFGATSGSASGNTCYTLDYSTVAPSLVQTKISLTESVSGGLAYYSVGVDAGVLSLNVGGSLAYWLDSADPTGFTSAAVNSIVVGGIGNVQKSIYDAKGGNLLLTLNSVNGARNPLTGFTSLGAYSHLYIVDSIISASVTTFFNEFAGPAPGLLVPVANINGYAVPEPAMLALFGIGLLAALGTRRRVS